MWVLEVGEVGTRNRRAARTMTRSKQGSTPLQEHSSSSVSSSSLWGTLCPQDPNPKVLANQLRIYPMHSFSKLWPGVRNEKDEELTDILVTHSRDGTRGFS